MYRTHPLKAVYAIVNTDAYQTYLDWLAIALLPLSLAAQQATEPLTVARILAATYPAQPIMSYIPWHHGGNGARRPPRLDRPLNLRTDHQSRMERGRAPVGQ